MDNKNPTIVKIFSIPGLNGSGPLHWQTRWEKAFGYTRIEQDDWKNPIFTQWEKRLIQTIDGLKEKDKPVLVAHSLGCHLVVKSLSQIGGKIMGAFLVAPPDLTLPALGKDLSDFAAAGMLEQSAHGCVVYSEDDPLASVAFSEKFARDFGFHSINAGRLGHINADSGLGEWKEGHELLIQFLKSLQVQTHEEQLA